MNKARIGTRAFLEELLDEVLHEKWLDLPAVKNLSTVFPGDYKSICLGRGDELFDLKPYRPMEDRLTDIDIPFSLRFGKLMARIFLEEKELQVFLVADVSEPMIWGGKASGKFSMLLKSIALIGSAALFGGNSLGGVCPGIPQSFRKPHRSRVELMGFLRVLCEYAGSISRKEALEQFSEAILMIDKPSLLVVFSDFFVREERLKEILRRKSSHGLMPVIIHSPLEHALISFAGESFTDLNSGRECLLDTNSETTREEFDKTLRAYEKRLFDFFIQEGITRWIHVSNPAAIFEDIFLCHSGPM